MTLTHKTIFALVTALFSPAIIAFLVFGRWSRDNVDVSIPALIYLVPLLLVTLLIRGVFHAKKVAAGIYILGMATLLTLAIASLWAELHGPIFGQIYIPTIALSFPFGLMAIMHKSAGEKPNATPPPKQLHV